MALGFHVVAALNATKQDLERAAGIFGGVEAREHGPWSWLITRATGDSAGAIATAVRGLAGPVLVFTTEDATGWRLVLVSEDRVRFEFTHHFAGLSQLIDTWNENDSEPQDTFEDRPWLMDPFFNGDPCDADVEPEANAGEIEAWLASLQELTEALPEGMVDDLRTLAAQNDVVMVYQCQADILLVALERHGIPHAAAEIRPILTGDAVTDQELDSDVGNLPRLLAALGLGPYFGDWVRRLVELDDVPPEIDELPEGGSEQAFELPAMELIGGAVSLAAKDFLDLCRIVWFCDPESVPVLRLAAADWDTPEAPEGVAKSADEDSVVFSFENVGLLLRKPRLLTSCLAGAPDGTAMEFGAWNDLRKAGRQRYAGTFAQDTWSIRATHPGMTAAQLLEALALARWVRGREPMEATGAEIEAVLAASEMQPPFYTGPPIAEANALRCRGWQREALALLLFRQRFGEVWDVAEGERIDRENHAEWLRLSAGSQGMITVPHTGEVVYEGLTGRFFRTDTEAFAERVGKSCKAWDEQMRALGFKHLGDFVAAERGQVAFRGYVSGDRASYLLLYVEEDQIPGRELYTAFDDGTSVTTTTMENAPSHRDQRALVRTSGEATAASLLREHEEGVQRVQRHGPTPVEVVPTLEGLARTMDCLLVRGAK